MGKRYHCDYCDKTFPDSASNRKKHLQGTYHMRMKKLHYDAFLDAASVLKAEATKKPCRRFQQTGACDYGNACKFTHLTPNELAELAARAEAESHAAKQRTSAPLAPHVTVQEWTRKRLKPQESVPEPFAYKDMIAATQPPTTAANQVLSASMRAPTLDDLLACVPNHWG